MSSLGKEIDWERKDGTTLDADAAAAAPAAAAATPAAAPAPVDAAG